MSSSILASPRDGPPEPVTPPPGRCASCAHWDEWLKGWGDCLVEVKARQNALIFAETAAAVPPPVCAEETAFDHGCGRHEAKG